MIMPNGHLKINWLSEGRLVKFWLKSEKNGPKLKKSEILRFSNFPEKIANGNLHQTFISKAFHFIYKIGLVCTEL